MEQGSYGHPARKPTWLYASKLEPPPLLWPRKSGQYRMLDQGFHTAAERDRGGKRMVTNRLHGAELWATPSEFRDLLISMAHSVVAK